MITVQLELEDGRHVCVVPQHVVVFGEIDSPVEGMLRPTLTLTTGEVLICKRVAAPPDVPQAVALQVVFTKTVENILNKLGRRAQLAGGFG